MEGSPSVVFLKHIFREFGIHHNYKKFHEYYKKENFFIFPIIHKKRQLISKLLIRFFITNKLLILAKKLGINGGNDNNEQV